MISLVLGIFYTIYTARYLGAAGYGVLSFALAFTGIFNIIADIGCNTLIIRDIARDKSQASKYIGNISLIEAVLSIISFGGILLCINLMGYPASTIMVVLVIGVAVTLSTFVDMFNAVFQANEKMEYLSYGTVINGVMMLAGTLVSVYLHFGIIAFASTYLIANLVTVGFCALIYVGKFPLPKLEVDPGFWREVLKESLPFGLSSLFITSYYMADTILLSVLVPNSNAVVGWYNAPYKLLLILINIPNIYMMVLFPIMSKRFADSDSALKLIFERSVKYMICISIPVIFATVLMANDIIMAIFGPGYAPAVPLLQIQIWSFLLAALGGVFGNFLNSTNKQATLMKIAACGMVFNIALNIVLIPIFSAGGASVISDLTRLIIIGLEAYVLYRLGFIDHLGHYINDMAKVVIAGLIMGAFIFIFRDAGILLLILPSAAIYILALHITKYFDSSDMSLAKEIFRRVKHGVE
jgi:O-antigen/teichoic acid export membrane protein